MDELIPLIDRFTAKRLAKVDHYMLPTDKGHEGQEVPTKALTVTSLLNVFYLFQFGNACFLNHF